MEIIINMEIKSPAGCGRKRTLSHYHRAAAYSCVGYFGLLVVLLCIGLLVN